MPSKPWPFRSLSERHRPFLARVLELYPPDLYPRVADVGGAGGYMAIPLLRAGYKVTVIDPAVRTARDRGLWKSPRRKPLPRGVKKAPRKFLVKDAADFDLLVGFFPCDASLKLIRAAKYKPLIFQPCWCRRFWPGEESTIKEISSYFRDMDVSFRKKGRIFWTPPKLHPPRGEQ